MKTLILERATESGITFREIAEQMGITYDELTELATMGDAISLHNLKEIADVIGCDIMDLVE